MSRDFDNLYTRAQEAIRSNSRAADLLTWKIRSLTRLYQAKQHPTRFPASPVFWVRTANTTVWQKVRHALCSSFKPTWHHGFSGLNRFPSNICFTQWIIYKRFQTPQPSVGSWLHSFRCHCPFWFPLVSFPWDQGDLFLVQGLSKWGVAIVTDSWSKPSPTAIPPAGKWTLPKVGKRLGVPSHCQLGGH